MNKFFKKILNNKKPILFGFILLTTYYLLPTVAQAATLYIFPQNEDFYEGQTFSADVRLDTEGEEINAVELRVYIEEGEELELADFTTGTSVFSIFVGGPEVDTEEKNVFLQAAEPGSFEGDGVIGTLILEAANPGEANLRFAENSKVALADGEGTPAEVSFEGATYTINERPQNLPVVVSKSHPMESKWAGGTFIRVEWEIKEGATYSYVLSRNPNEVPDEVPEEAVGDLKLSTREEGIFYFHLRECTGGDSPDESAEVECGPTATRQILRDVSKPEKFEIIADSDADRTFLSFSTKDNVSGLSHWEIFEGERHSVIQNPPYVLKDPDYEGKVIVKAFDKAGNSQQATISMPGERITYNKWLVVGIIVSVAGAAVFNFLWKHKKGKGINEKGKTTS